MKKNLLTKEELRGAWLRVNEIYAETRERNRPGVTAERIVEELGLPAAVQAFAAVAKLKKHDGRIYGKNREAMEAVETAPGADAWEGGNPLLRARLDDIHPSHINDIITSLRVKYLWGGEWKEEGK